MCERQLSRVVGRRDKSELAYGAATLHATLRYANVTSSDVVSMATAQRAVPLLSFVRQEVKFGRPSNCLLPFQIIIKLQNCNTHVTVTHSDIQNTLSYISYIIIN